MQSVKVKRAFYGVEKGVRAGDVIAVADDRAKSLERKGLVEILGEAKEAGQPGNKQAPKPSDKQAPSPATKSERDPLDHDGDGKKGGSPKPDGSEELDAARARYADVFGKRPFHGWDVDALNTKIGEASVEEVAANGLTRREIEADLTAMEVEFDPSEKLDDLAALRDLSREERDQA